MEDYFVDLHKEEIEREAFRIYKQRDQYHQDDNAVSNFLQAISNVKRRYNHDGSDRRRSEW